MIHAVRNRRPPRVRLAALAVAALLLGPTPAAAQADDVPKPEDGAWAGTTLALLGYYRNLCDGIAEAVTGVWRRSGDDEGEQALRDFVLEEQLSDLAAARAAAEIIDDFLPTAQGEVSDETGSALGRLFELETSLCDAVANPVGPRTRFEEQIGELHARMATEERELGRLLVVPDNDPQAAVEPYLLAIQLAGVEAQGELIAYYNSLKPKPQGPTEQELMEAWHRSYSRAVWPSKEALRRFQLARREGDRGGVGRACRDLARETILLLQEPEVFAAPEPSLAEPLRRAFLNFKLMAGACSAGNFTRVDEHITQAQRSLGMAAETLDPYGLRP